jgi:hypothetical protein
MKKFIAIVLLLVIIILVIQYFVNRVPPDKLRFARNQFMLLEKGEKNIYPINKEMLDIFQDYAYLPHANLMLNRAIEGPANIFIAIEPELDTVLFDLAQRKDSLLHIFDTRIQNISKTVFKSFLMKKKDLFIFRNLYKEKGYEELIVIDIVGRDSMKIADFYHNKDYLLKFYHD